MRLRAITINLLLVFIVCILGTFGLVIQAEASSAIQGMVSENDVKEHVTSLRMPFVQNQGQVEDVRVKFYANTFAGTVFVTNDGITYSLPGEDGNGWAVKEEFNGAKGLAVTALGAPAAPINYFVGNDQEKWRQNIPAYEEISLGEVYDHINISLRAYGNNVEKIFSVNPGGDPGVIGMKVIGVDKLSVNDLGELELATGLGAVKMTRPVAYQDIDGRHVDVDVAYVVNGDKYSFKLGDYNYDYPLVIDPLLAGTFLGVNSKNDNIKTIKLCEEKVYVTGQTLAPTFPVTTGAVYNKSYDIFVTVLNSDLSGELVASTLFGGTGSDTPIAMDINDSGVYIAGTPSTAFPVVPQTGALQTTGTSKDSFITKLSPDLNSILASTYFGGSANTDKINDLVLDDAGNVYVTGFTQASNFPTTSGAYDTVPVNYSPNLQDAFVSKLTGDLSELTASTLLGAKDTQGPSNMDEGKALVIDPQGNIYVTGWTNSSDYKTTTGAYQETSPQYGGVFVSKLNSNLSGPLMASTLIGQEGGTYYYSQDIVMDAAGNVIIAGLVSDTQPKWDFPITSGVYTSPVTIGRDVFVTMLNGSLSGPLLASTRLGGSASDTLISMELDAQGYVYIGGKTNSLDYPKSSGAYQPEHAGTTGDNFFISRLSPDLSRLDASTYLGSSENDSPGGMTVAPDGTVYVAGSTKSASFPHTDGSFQPTFSGGTNTDGFITRLSPDLSRETPYWPNSPTLTATNVTNIGLTLTWNPATYYTGVASYKIYQDDVEIGTVSGDTTSFNIPELSAGIEYAFKVEASSDTNLWSDDGPTLTQKTVESADSEPPTWPENRTLEASEVTETGLTLTWTAASDNNAVNGYRVYQVEGNEEKLLDTVGGNILTYTVTELSSGMSYKFRIEAGDAFNNWSTINNPFVEEATQVHDDIAPVWPSGSTLRIGQ